ncbi:MAG: ATP-binding protein [Kiritimatiellae bacterium]|nr:ATP-binding protein [Kiritimatiellia bacterium]MDW8457726.1 ATP-binding protein [Verrucomicrobiota bacterium]
MSPEKDLKIEGFVTLHLPCRYSYLRMIRQSVLDICARAGLSEVKTAQLEMAVDEACANVIEHSYGGEANATANPNHPGIRINLIQCKDRVIVEIYDRGKGFDFDNQPSIDPETYVLEGRQRGLGMYIIRKFVDDAIYERGTPAGNCLRLTKFF